MTPSISIVLQIIVKTNTKTLVEIKKTESVYTMRSRLPIDRLDQTFWIPSTYQNRLILETIIIITIIILTRGKLLLETIIIIGQKYVECVYYDVISSSVDSKNTLKTIHNNGKIPREVFHSQRRSLRITEIKYQNSRWTNKFV